jgi:hypothetical protein
MKYYRCGSGEHLALACKFKQTVSILQQERSRGTKVKGEKDKDLKARSLL